jgi:hypothetical protein
MTAIKILLKNILVEPVLTPKFSSIESIVPKVAKQNNEAFNGNIYKFVMKVVCCEGHIVRNAVLNNQPLRLQNKKGLYSGSKMSRQKEYTL